MAQVPSGWTTSGIDWSSVSTMRNSRTEDIIRELYQATYEREVFVKSFSEGVSYYNSFNNTSNDFWDALENHSRLRVREQIDFIYKTIQKWLSIDSVGEDEGLYIGSNSIFIDENQIPTGLVLSPDRDNSTKIPDPPNFYPTYHDDLTSDHINMSIPHYDMSQNGNLESAINLDLSFLRNYSGGITREGSLLHLKSIYEILSFLTKSRAFQVEKDGSQFVYRLRSSLTSLWRVTTYSRYGQNWDGDSQSAYDEWVSDPPQVESSANRTIYYEQRVDERDTGNRFYIQNWDAYLHIQRKPYGFNKELFDEQDFQFNTLFHAIPQSSIWTSDSNLGYNPSMNLQEGINIVGDIKESGSIRGVKAFAHPNEDMQNFPPVPSAGEPDNYYTAGGYMMPYINTNKEGFLKYYTEST